MSDFVIAVDDLAKRYVLSRAVDETEGLRHVLERKIKAPFAWLRNRGKPGGTDLGPGREEFWALRGVSFEIRQGDVVGVIGRNGAGKSTLLKILSRIIEPTAGRIRMQGRASSLLEVGTGFHPELTGRENIYLNGAILGMRRAEIKAKFDEIVAFAEIERFLDTPVKRYSSGMYVRLAFGVAAHLEPDILIVDEVLAVGDAQFQKKCLGKMKEVSQTGGRTVLFVSHQMSAVAQLCNRGILLQEGRKVMDGTAHEAISHYMKLGEDRRGEVRWDDPAKAPASEGVRLISVALRQDGRLAPDVRIEHPLDVVIEFENLRPGARLAGNLHLLDQLNGEILSTVNWPGANASVDDFGSGPLGIGRYSTTCQFPANFFNEGAYSLNVIILSDRFEAEIGVREAISFQVQDTGDMRRDGYRGQWIGIIRPKLPWRTEPVA